MDTKQGVFVKYSEGLLPQEEILEVKKQQTSLTIGIPKENFNNENRVALVPEAVGLLIENGHKVIIENETGIAAHFENSEYAEAGATIVYSHEEVFKSDIILKVAPLDASEICLLKTRQTIISALNIANRNKDYFRELSSKRVTALAFEYIKDKTKTYPVTRSISEIAGNTAILLAADYLSDLKYGKGIMLGGVSGITPTEVVIIGAGTVGEYAARAAIGLGAYVKIFDNSIYKLRRLQNNINERICTSIIQPKVLLKALKTAHVVVGAIHSNNGRTPCVVTEEMVKQMKQGSVIIDVSIDQGGCFETSEVTSHCNPVFVKHGVTHYCVPNISSKVPQTASYALSNCFAPIILSISEAGGIENMLKSDYGVRQGVYIFNGTITSKYIAETYQLPFQDIELLMLALR
ncbi:MAG: alanine dehydrogenase [Bacteroidetes bacterium]|nr:alanine dehydrogenase [Bacteroidota bacterium]